ncbi:ArgE/DapE family deacylase [Castellaniella sp. GW247-6E4]|uniref:ArgE/DapE family deacylase n=1 Tax=Castellaniella sp. GW247-6E4 TaxID=3140380 RepID=UPI00331596D6
MSSHKRTSPPGQQTPQAAPAQNTDGARERLRATTQQTAEEVVSITSQLVAIPSESPPGDTRAIAEVIAGIIRGIDGAQVELITSEPHIVNVVARLQGHRPGRRLIFNGHLDTFPAGKAAQWQSDPFTATQREGFLYGRGVSDMKGGVATSIYAMKTLSAWRSHWRGELVLTLAGDEETMGRLGTDYLLDHVAHATGDAMISGDAGSPRVLRFGEKGMLWMEVHAHGQASHGAHVHLGCNAIDRLMAALQRLSSLRDYPVALPKAVDAAIEDARAVSESISGQGEAEVLRKITVNIGTIDGGTSKNLVADHAHAGLDIRIPPGVDLAKLEAHIASLLDPLEGIEYQYTNRYEPSYTDPEHEIVALTAAACAEVLGQASVLNMRVGASDSRLYRYRGIPSVVCGPTPYRLGAADEHVEVEELKALGRIFVLAAFDYLQQGAESEAAFRTQSIAASTPRTQGKEQ